MRGDLGARHQRVSLRSPAPSDRDEFIALMRGSRSFHRALATAPTDDDRFDAYLTDSRRSDFEAMLQCRREDLAILGCFNLSQIVRRSSSLRRCACDLT